MSARPAVYPRIQRRETHASRATPAVVVALLAVVALVYLVTEIVLAAAGRRPLLASPAGMVRALSGVGSVPVVWLALAGVVLAVLGIVLLIAALAAGRRPRHVLENDRAVVVIDDEVIASALVRTAAGIASIDPDRALGAVSRRTATVRVTPTSGVPVQRGEIASALRDQLDAWALKPALRPRVRVSSSGKVGA